jgi:septal ring factor EnvC (AmiA/AmiB activator)
MKGENSMLDNLNALIDEIKEKQSELNELRKEYREQKTAGLRSAIEQRNEADKLVREELKSLGYNYKNPYESLFRTGIA